MQFLAPLALIALVPLAGAIILLYLLKLRRKDHLVSSTFLWRRAVQDVQANTPFQKLHANLLLLLQLLALIALVVGLAAPFLLAPRLGGKSSIIVLDASASMKATDVPGSRFEVAKALAAEIINGLGRQDEASLLICSDHPQLALSFSQDRGRLLAALRDAEPTDCSTNVRDGLLLAFSLAAKRPDSQIYVISDGAFPALPEVSSPAEVRFLRVGEDSNNVALLAFEAARPPDAREHQLFLRMRNFSNQPKRALLSIAHDGELFHASDLELAPGESRTETYALALEAAGLLTAELEVDDDLAVDNTCYAFAEPPSALSVLLVGPGNLFLEQALLVQPEVEVFRTATLGRNEAEAAYRDYDVVIFDRVAPPVTPRTGAFFAIGVSLSGTAEIGSEASPPDITSWEDQHPALRFVNLGAVQIAQAKALTPAPGASVLARAGEAPVIVAQQGAGFRAIAFGLNFLDTDLPLRVGFPVLLSNTLQWLSQTDGRALTMRIHPGEIVRLPAPPDAERAKVVLPDGRTETVEAVEGTFTFAGSGRIGTYELRAGDRVWRWAADLRDADESDLTPAEQLRLGEREVRADAGPPQSERHFWPWLAALALLLLLGEWHLYHRRY